MAQFEAPQLPEPEKNPTWIDYMVAVLTVIGFWFLCMVLWAIKG